MTNDRTSCSIRPCFLRAMIKSRSWIIKLWQFYSLSIPQKKMRESERWWDHYASLWNIGPKHKIIEESNDNLPHIALESGKIDWSCMYRSGYISPTKCLRGLSQLLTYTSLSSVWFIELECKKPADAAYLRGIFLVFDVNAVPFLAWGRVQMTPA